MPRMSYQPQAAGQPLPDSPLPGQPGAPPPVYELSGWWRRVGAEIIDAIIIMVISMVFVVPFVTLAVTQAALTEGPDSAFSTLDIGLNFLSLAVGAVYYCAIMVSTNGRTIGKMAAGIRVVREDGEAVDVWFAFKRQTLVITLLFNTLGLLLLWIPGLLNYLWPLWDEKNQALHDKIVHSRVVMADAVENPPYHPPGQFLPAGGYPPAAQPYAPQPPQSPQPGLTSSPAPMPPPTPQPGQPYAPSASTQPGQAPPQPYQPPPDFTNPVPEDD